jgi:hypothetical protein
LQKKCTLHSKAADPNTNKAPKICGHKFIAMKKEKKKSKHPSLFLRNLQPNDKLVCYSIIVIKFSLAQRLNQTFNLYQIFLYKKSQFKIDLFSGQPNEDII